MQGNELYKIWEISILVVMTGVIIGAFLGYLKYKWQDHWKPRLESFIDKNFEKYID